MYYNLDEIETELTRLGAEFPTLLQVFDLPHKTGDGKCCRAIRLTAPGQGPQRDAVMLLAGLHGGEWGSCEIVLSLARDLADAYTSNVGLGYTSGGNRLGKLFEWEELRDLIDGREILIFPLVNPDGRARSMQGDFLWRKNCRSGKSRSGIDVDGVDINRNFEFLFDIKSFANGCGLSVSDDPGSGFYHGDLPFSEPETCNVQWLLDQHPNTRWFVDLHSSGPCIRYVWSHASPQSHSPGMNFQEVAYDGKRGAPGYEEYLPAEDLAEMQTLAQRFVRDAAKVCGTTFACGPAFQGAPYSGTSHDYVYSRQFRQPPGGRVLSFYVEWGDEMQPTWLRMEDVIKEVSAGLIGFCLETL
jgi:murein tripeptide amidase MpaA